MHAVKSTADLAKPAAYRELVGQLTALFAGERNGLANAANMSALLYEALPDLNWVGFYFLQGGELVLGPFQGSVACVRIALGRGVALGDRGPVDSSGAAPGGARFGQPSIGPV